LHKKIIFSVSRVGANQKLVKVQQEIVAAWPRVVAVAMKYNSLSWDILEVEMMGFVIGWMLGMRERTELKITKDNFLPDSYKLLRHVLFVLG
jgi:hypothetical protein